MRLKRTQPIPSFAARFLPAREPQEELDFMNERLNELKGNLKETTGRVTGDAEMQAEGRGEQEVSRAERKVKGTGEEIKGRIEQGIGNLSGDNSQRAEGAADRTGGNLDRAG